MWQAVPARSADMARQLLLLVLSDYQTTELPERFMNNHVPSKSETNIRRDLRAIFVEGVAFSVMVGIGESYLPAFVLALGMGEVASGLIATVPLLAGGVLQIVSPYGVRLVGSHRRWAAASAATQATIFVPLVLGSWRGSMPGFIVFALATLYWASGMAIGPVWNVWVEKLVPPAIRPRYFARRTGAAHLGVLAGLLAGGMILDRAPHDANPLIGFAALFVIAGTSRYLSAGLLGSQSRTDLNPPHEHPLATLRLLKRFPRGGGGALLIYMLALTVTVSIASPFFTAYMLRRLGLSYSAYMALIGCALAAKSIALPVLGRLAPRLGLPFLLRAAWVGIAAVPALWLVSSSYPYLVALQFLSGSAWAAHEYITFLLLFELIRGQKRLKILSAYNLGNAVATAGGSLLGGFLFTTFGGGATGYHVIFTVSSLLRAGCVVLLARVPGVRLPVLKVAFRPIAVRPATGVLIRPILATLRTQRRNRVHHREDSDSDNGPAETPSD
jgi:MFS family permease